MLDIYIPKLANFGWSFRYPLLATMLLLSGLAATLDWRRRSTHLGWLVATVILGAMLEAETRFGLVRWGWIFGLPVLLMPAFYGIFLTTTRSFQQAAPPVRPTRRQATPEAQAPKDTVLPIRSTAEQYLYMDFHPCTCGEADWSKLKQSLLKVGPAMATVYAGPCSGCGTRREFLFNTMSAGAQPRDASFGGPEPSAILDPGQFLAASDRWATGIPGSANGLDSTARRRAATTLKKSIAALEEVLKFIPPGAEEPPRSAFTSAESARLMREVPGQFRKPRLEARLKAYKGILAQFD